MAKAGNSVPPLKAETDAHKVLAEKNHYLLILFLVEILRVVLFIETATNLFKMKKFEINKPIRYETFFLRSLFKMSGFDIVKAKKSFFMYHLTPKNLLSIVHTEKYVKSHEFSQVII